MNEALRHKWQVLLQTWRVNPALVEQTFDELRDFYADSCRHYHTFAHVQHVLTSAEALSSHAQDANAVYLEKTSFPTAGFVNATSGLEQKRWTAAYRAVARVS
jgi:predicted metal-dependent HD superfamily phosphohydrolase